MNEKKGEKAERLSLREVCSTFAVSRRAVQGYEKYGLLIPSGKTAMGHLYYDRAAQQRVRRIRQLQQYGFSLKEIAVLLDAPNDLLRHELGEKLQNLYQKNQELNKIIKELRGDILNLNNISPDTEELCQQGCKEERT